MERQALQPRSPRGHATKAMLVEAARRVFERDGFVAARIADIGAEAGLATGSFYTYFKDKNEIFAAVMAAVQEEMLHPLLSEPPAGSGPVAMIEAANRAYLESYRRNARLMGLMEQVASVDEDFRELRRRRAAAFAKRNAASIASLQERGLADPGLDPNLASTALSGMVSRAAYSTYVLGEDVPLETLVASLTRLWASALRLPDED